MYVCMYLHKYVGVGSLREGTVTANVITVMWDDAVSPSGCGPVLYCIVTAVNLADASDMSTMETRESVAEISNLQSNTSYNISVAAVNRAGIGSPSMITVTTLTEKSKQLKYVHTYIMFLQLHNYSSH